MANVHSNPDTSSLGWLFSVRIPLSIALLSPGFAGISLLPATAQVAGPAQETTTASPDAIKQREQELEATRAQQKSAAEAQAKLKADIAAIGQDRSKLNQQLIDIAAQVRSVETRIGDAEARLRPLDSRVAGNSRLAGFAPLRDRGGAGGAATRRPAHAAGLAGAARRRPAIAAYCHAARLCGARIADTRGKNWPATSLNWLRFEKPSPPNAIDWPSTATNSG